MERKFQVVMIAKMAPNENCSPVTPHGDVFCPSMIAPTMPEDDIPEL